MEYKDIDFQDIFDTFQPKVLRYLSHLVGAQEAEDVTQEVFLKVSRALGSFRGDSQLSTWIYRIATNTALDRLRSPARRQAAQEPLTNDSTGDANAADAKNAWTEKKTLSIEQQLVRQEMGECIVDYIKKLPESYQTVLVLVELEGLKNKQVADILGVTLDTVKIRLHRARARLKEELAAGCDFYWIEDNEFVPNLWSAANRPDEA